MFSLVSLIFLVHFVVKFLNMFRQGCAIHVFIIDKRCFACIVSLFPVSFNCSYVYFLRCLLHCCLVYHIALQTIAVSWIFMLYPAVTITVGCHVLNEVTCLRMSLINFIFTFDFTFLLYCGLNQMIIMFLLDFIVLCCVYVIVEEKHFLLRLLHNFVWLHWRMDYQIIYS